tara:strand:- start:98 stop:472 length:375 start_codon:yes stop_codon:yes gene_type:complete
MGGTCRNCRQLCPKTDCTSGVGVGESWANEADDDEADEEDSSEDRSRRRLILIDGRVAIKPLSALFMLAGRCCSLFDIVKRKASAQDAILVVAYSKCRDCHNRALNVVEVVTPPRPWFHSKMGK